MSGQDVEDFRSAIAAAGLRAPEHIIADGQIHRFSSSGRPRDDAGWYAYYPDDIAGGTFGCWRTGMQASWGAKVSHSLTQAERDSQRQRLAALQAQREADVAQRQQQAREAVAVLLARASPATSHPYLTNKGIAAHGSKTDGVRLLIPLRDAAGVLHSLQTIALDGEKRFHSGGKVTGCYFAIGKIGKAGKVEKPDDALVVCEGFATGASIHECTGYAVAVAFNAGNLLAVAAALHAKYPQLAIVIAADDDAQTPGNPGLTQAHAAAQAVGGRVAVPDFAALGQERPVKATDFNDLHQLRGAPAVQHCFAQAQLVQPLPDAGSEPVSEPAFQAQPEPWSEPVPLPDGLPPVEPFTAELLPDALREWVMDIAQRMQCPADFPAVAALVALSSLIGARAVVQPKVHDDWVVVPNLWGAVVGRPGVKKSPALTEALRPLRRLEQAEQERWLAEHAAWQVECKLASMQGEANEKKAKDLISKDPAKARALLQTQVQVPTEPVQRRFVVNDATVEKLGELLQHHPWGTLSYRDELYGLLTSLDKAGQEGSRAFYLTGYDGNQSYTFDRIQRGTVHIERVCLAMLGGIQPGRIQEYVRGAMAGGGADDGLLQRFGLAVWPDIAGEFEHVDQWPDTQARQTAWDVFERLAQLSPHSESEPQVWRFTPEAQAGFVQWLVPLEQELRSDALHPALVSHLAKYRKLVPALALVFALVDAPHSPQLVDTLDLRRALAWAHYLRSHAQRLYASASAPQTQGAACLLSKIRAGKLADGFTPRDVLRKCWSGLTAHDVVRQAAQVLADFGWLRSETVCGGEQGGRPSERYRLHPSLLAVLAKGAAHH